MYTVPRGTNDIVAFVHLAETAAVSKQRPMHVVNSRTSRRRNTRRYWIVSAGGIMLATAANVTLLSDLISALQKNRRCRACSPSHCVPLNDSGSRVATSLSNLDSTVRSPYRCMTRHHLHAHARACLRKLCGLCTPHARDAASLACEVDCCRSVVRPHWLLYDTWMSMPRQSFPAMSEHSYIKGSIPCVRKVSLLAC